MNALIDFCSRQGEHEEMIWPFDPAFGLNPVSEKAAKRHSLGPAPQPGQPDFSAAKPGLFPNRGLFLEV